MDIAPDQTPDPDEQQAPAQPEPVEGSAPPPPPEADQPPPEAGPPPADVEAPPPASAHPAEDPASAPPELPPDWRSLPPSIKIRLGLARLKPLKQRRFPPWYTRRD